MKHRIQITKPLRVKVQYAFYVEYDTETGEAEIVSEGHAVSHPDTLRRRELMVRIDFDDIDDDALIKLIDEGKIERPGIASTVMHHGRPHEFSIDLTALELDLDDEGNFVIDPDDLAKITGGEVVEALVNTDRPRRVPRVVRRRRKHVRDNQ